MIEDLQCSVQDNSDFTSPMSAKQQYDMQITVLASLAQDNSAAELARKLPAAKVNREKIRLAREHATDISKFPLYQSKKVHI